MVFERDGVRYEVKGTFTCAHCSRVSLMLCVKCPACGAHLWTVRGPIEIVRKDEGNGK